MKDKPKTKRFEASLPFGEYPNPKGTQVLDFESAQKLCSNFKPVPVYIGNPLVNPDADSKKYGTVTAIEIKDESLVISVDMNFGLEEKFLSPTWKFERIENRKIRPIELACLALEKNDKGFISIPIPE